MACFLENASLVRCFWGGGFDKCFSVLTLCRAGGGKNKVMKGIEEVFGPILKVINVGSVLECSAQSLGVVMNVCMELAADDACKKRVCRTGTFAGST